MPFCKHSQVFISGEKMFLLSLSISKSIQLLHYATIACDRGSPVVGHQLGLLQNSRFNG